MWTKQRTPLVCSFCGRAAPAWSFPSLAWLLCAECAPLFERDDAEGLRRRYLAMHPGLSPAEAGAAVTLRLPTFRDRWDGHREPFGSGAAEGG